MEKPYVISAELELGYESIIQPRQIETWRESLDEDLRACGKNTLWIGADRLQTGLNQQINATKLPVLSLDSCYASSADSYLGISRGVGKNLDDAGYQARAGYAPIDAQLNSIAKIGSEIVIADDVVFSGEMIGWLADEMAARNVKIGGVVCGIAIRDGVEKLAERNIPVYAVEEFDDVDDEICERDFALLPGSGRRVGVLRANALYFDPKNGKPEQWMSLPAYSTEAFCRGSLERSLKLLRPELPISAVGSFVGYGQSGTAQQQIVNRLGEM